MTLSLQTGNISKCEGLVLKYNNKVAEVYAKKAQTEKPTMSAFKTEVYPPHGTIV
jgi:hypothetical protein